LLIRMEILYIYHPENPGFP